MSFDWDSVVELYHGSPDQVPYPDVYHSAENRDFERGFYLFPNREDALRNLLPYLDYDRLDYQICVKTKEAERSLRFLGAERCY